MSLEGPFHSELFCDSACWQSISTGATGLRLFQSDIAEGLCEPRGVLIGTALQVATVYSYIPGAEVCAALVW